jgi:undecaprenyl-diphosphatase
MGVFLYNKKAGILLLAIGIIHGLARIYVGIHYPLDILGGAGIGIITALIMNVIAVWQKPNLNKLLGLMERVHLT